MKPFFAIFVLLSALTQITLTGKVAVSGTAGVSNDGVWPTLPAFSSNNFLDHFSGSSLDARWTSLTASGGSVSVTDSYAALSSSGTGDASAIYYNAKLNKSRSQLWTMCFSRQSGNVSPYFCIWNNTTAPTAGAQGAAGADTHIRVFSFYRYNTGSSGAITLSYNDTSHTRLDWNPAGPAWTTTVPQNSVTPTRSADYYILGFEMDAANQRWRIIWWGLTYTSGYQFDQGWRLFALTDWVDWSSLETSSDLWLVLGNTSTDASPTPPVEQRFEWVRYAENNNPIEGWCAAKATTAAGHTFRRYYSYDGLTFVPTDRATDVLAATGGWEGTEINEPNLVSDGATDWLFYGGGGGAGIGVAKATHAFPQTNTFTRGASNPIIARGGSDLAEGFPWVIKDLHEANANKRWKMLFSIRASDGKWRLHYATAPDPPDTSTWTDQGVVLDVGAGGSADANAARDGVAVRYGGQWEVWYEGWDASGNVSMMRATGSDLAVLSKDGAGARLSGQANGTTTLTANLTGNTVTVASTTGFVQDGFVILDQDSTSDNYSTSRVRKVVNATTLELYHSLDGFTTTAPAKIKQMDAFKRFSPRLVVRVGTEWWFYTVSWGPFDDDATFRALMEQNTLFTHTAAAPAGGTPAMNMHGSPVTSRGFNSDGRSLENMSLLMRPY